MTETETYEAVEAMLTYGGSFARALAKAYRAADALNREILRQSFPKVFEDYAGLTKGRTDG